MRIRAFIPLLFILFLLAACGGGGYEENYDLEISEPAASQVNFVDERYELVSLVFRLAGTPSHSTTQTSYQRALRDTFADFSDHPVVEFTRHYLTFGYDAILQMAVHLEKTGDGFALRSNIDSLVGDMSGFYRWTRANASTFVELLNDFYVESDFASFFERHIEYFELHTARFIEQVYSDVNHEWFRQHGLNPYNLRAIISPSCSRNGYASWVFGDNPEDTIVYACLPGALNYRGYLAFIIHEYTHAFANHIGEAWYAENEIFRSWADASVDLARMPFYSTGQVIANEYVVRAYTILYMVENQGVDPIPMLFNEISQGFTHIFEVYAMVENSQLAGSELNLILGDIDFIISEEEYQFSSDTLSITWRFLDLQGYVLDINDFEFSQVGNAFNTSLGDALLVRIGSQEFLYIDIGCGVDVGWSAQHRQYSVFFLSEFE
ncbi:MAG: DUF4932 domain-containing protein [Defluviitaleaceae bacterium]|nr:DUF4932 domain-containing protein [Defluviitaleaceae bacterium]